MSSELITDKTLVPWYRRPWFGFLSLLIMWPLALLLMWTGPTYYLARGGYKRMGKISKTLLSISQILLLVIYAAKFLSDDQGASSASPDGAKSSSASGAPSPDTPSPSTVNDAAAPNMRVQTEPGPSGGFYVEVTGDDDQPFTVQRVVTNGRAGEAGCDSTLKVGALEPYVPATLKRGDTTAALLFCGSALLTADVYTERGKKSFTFN